MNPCGKRVWPWQWRWSTFKSYWNNLCTSFFEFIDLYIVNISLVFQFNMLCLSFEYSSDPWTISYVPLSAFIFDLTEFLALLIGSLYFLLVLGGFPHGMAYQNPQVLVIFTLFTDLVFPHLVNLFLHYWLFSALDFFYVLHTILSNLPIHNLVIFCHVILPCY